MPSMPPPSTVADAGVLAGSDAGDLATIAEVTQQVHQFAEMGLTGLKRSGGYLDDEFLPQLRGRKAVQIYREMSDNDPIAGALIFAIRMLLRNVDWRVQAAGKDKEAAKAAKLVETCMQDMSHSWDEMISEALSSVIYGWSWHEIVYKRRMGPWQKDGRHRSKFDDGLIGWRKLPLRSQDTLLRWVFDESGGTQGMVQLAPPTYKTVVMPIERSLLFRFGHTKGSPEGRSALRNAYRPWYYKKRLEEIEAVGVERDLAGLPMVSVPASFLKAKPGTEQHRQVQAFQKMVRSIRRDEQEGLVFPIEYDQDTRQPLYKFELLSGGGGRAFNTGDIIKRYEERMLMTVLADFILVGHQSTGTYNMHLDKTGMFRTALNATTDMIADVFNRHAIPRLFAANGWKPSELPKIVPSEADAPDLGQLTQFLTGTANLGFNWGPDADLEKFLRQTAGLPELNTDDENRHRTMARREEAARMAESQSRLLETKTMLLQMQQQAEMAEQGQMPPDPEAQAAEQQMQGNAQAQELAGAEGEQKLAHADEAHQMEMASRAQALKQGQDKGKIDQKAAATKEKLALAAAKGARAGQKGRKK